MATRRNAFSGIDGDCNADWRGDSTSPALFLCLNKKREVEKEVEVEYKEEVEKEAENENDNDIASLRREPAGEKLTDGGAARIGEAGGADGKEELFAFFNESFGMPPPMLAQCDLFR